MAKTIFVCNECGFESAKWFGACPSCKEYNTFFEQKQETKLSIENVNRKMVIQQGEVEKLSSIEHVDDKRISTNISELDRVFGGGIVQGSFTLIGGQPGIGKSTIVLQMVSEIAKTKRVLYVSGEESLSQIKIRANRLEINNTEKILMLASNNLDFIFEKCNEEKIEMLIIDSIQTLYLEGVNSLQGTPAQLKACTMELMKHAKVNAVTTLIIGHVTKEGEIAGPKQLEHMVDTVMYLESDESKKSRILRNFKNRFGPISEIGIFNMTKSGLIPWDISKSEIINSEFEIGNARSIIVAGERIFLTDIQVLINQIDFGHPKRIAQGLENTRLNIIVALLENQTKMDFRTDDVFVKNLSQITGNNNLLDLATVIALVSAKINRPLPQSEIFVGEVSLSGKIYPVNVEQNLKALKQVGIQKIVGNITNKECELQIIKVTTINDVLNYLFK